MATTLFSIPTARVSNSTLTPSFIGIVKGEIIKLVRQRTFWFLLGVMAFFSIGIIGVLPFVRPDSVRSHIAANPTEYMYHCLAILPS
jgi:hypothetical protein